MLRQNGPITKSGVLLVAAYFFFGKFFSVLEPLKKNQFDVPTTQMSIFVFFVSESLILGCFFPVSNLNQLVLIR